MKKLIIILLINTFVLANEEFYKTSYNCSNTKPNSVEYKVCKDKDLAKLDLILSSTWKSFRLITKLIKHDQKKWIKSKNRCKDNTCIKDSYLSRIDELYVSLKGQKTFPDSVLKAMKEAEKLITVVNAYESKDLSKESEIFMNDIFRFKNIKFKKAIDENLKFDSPELKKFLGKCYGYRFFDSVEQDQMYNKDGYVVLKNYKYGNYVDDGKGGYTHDEHNTKDAALYSTQNITIKGKDYFLIKQSLPWYLYDHLYLIDKSRCASFGKKHKFDLVKALNAKVVSESYNYSGKNYLMEYKNKKVILNISHFGIYYFAVYKLFAKDIYANNIDRFAYTITNYIKFMTKEKYEELKKTNNKIKRWKIK